MAFHDAVVTVGLRESLEIKQVPTVKPEDGEVRVRVLWTASTPLDLHQNDGGLLVTYPQVLGDGLGGEVVEIGPGVDDLKVGDQVFGFTFRSNKEKAHQVYATLPVYLLGKKPSNVSFESAVTLPNNFVTAWHTLVTDLFIDLPYPKPDGYEPQSAELPFLIWGGSTSVGQFAIQLLQYYGYKRIVTTASQKHHNHLARLGAQLTVDYNNADVVGILRKEFGNAPIRVLDCVGSLGGSVVPVSKVAITEGSIVAILLPIIVKDASEADAPEYSTDTQTATTWSKGVVVHGVRTHFYLNNEFHKKNLQPIIMPELLERGIIQPNRYKLIEGETLLERAQNALNTLRRKEVSGERLVWRVSEK